MYVIKPEISKLTEADVRKALDSRDEDNLIVLELSRLLKDLVQELNARAQRGDDIGLLLNREPACPLEKVALEMLGDMKAAFTGEKE